MNRKMGRRSPKLCFSPALVDNHPVELFGIIEDIVEILDIADGILTYSVGQMAIVFKQGQDFHFLFIQ